MISRSANLTRLTNRTTKKKLAISLVVNLGFEGAVHSCQANSWAGVLKWVFALKETDEGDTSSA